MSVDTQENTANNYPSFSDINQPQSIEIPDAYRPSIQSSMAKVAIHIGEPSFTAKDTKAKKQVQNANPINKMRNIAADASFKPGGGPPTMPGVKPMVAPPSAPAPQGMEGLLNRLGGK